MIPPTTAARLAVADALAGVPGLTVHPHPVTLDHLDPAGVAIVAATRAEYTGEAATACGGIAVTVEVILAGGIPDTSPAATFDGLDALLADAVTALDGAGLRLLTADLSTILDTAPAYALTLEVPA